MTRYRVVRDGKWRPADGMPYEKIAMPHPEHPFGGFATWTEAELWLMERFLPPHIWRVEPFAVEVAP